MSRSVFDLASLAVRLPRQIVIDTNLLVARLLTAHRTPTVEEVDRSSRLFWLLRSQEAVGIVASVSLAELLHVAIRAKYRSELPNQRAALAVRWPTKRGFDWRDLYKLRPDIRRSFAPDLERLRQLFVLHGLVVLRPEDLGPVPDG